MALEIETAERNFSQGISCNVALSDSLLTQNIRFCSNGFLCADTQQEASWGPDPQGLQDDGLQVGQVLYNMANTHSVS